MSTVYCNVHRLHCGPCWSGGRLMKTERSLTGHHTVLPAAAQARKTFNFTENFHFQMAHLRLGENKEE